MSYDFIIFEPDAIDDAGFDAWYRAQLEDDMGDDISVATPALQAFYRELILAYPAMNGPDSPSEQAMLDDPRLETKVTDYSIAPLVISASFAWSESDAAMSVVGDLMDKHPVAVANYGVELLILRPEPAPEPPKRWWSRK